MFKAKVRLVYRQVIDAASSSSFEKAIHNASYHEYLLKSQVYNPDGKFNTFSELKANDGRANSLHYKLSFSVGQYIAQLDNKIPVVTDNLGNKLLFETARFELVESHASDIAQHKVAINYETPVLILANMIGEYLLLAADENEQDDTLRTFLIRLQPGLSIVSYLATPGLQPAEDNRQANFIIN